MTEIHEKPIAQAFVNKTQDTATTGLRLADIARRVEQLAPSLREIDEILPRLISARRQPGFSSQAAGDLAFAGRETLDKFAGLVTDSGDPLLLSEEITHRLSLIKKVVEDLEDGPSHVVLTPQEEELLSGIGAHMEDRLREAAVKMLPGTPDAIMVRHIARLAGTVTGDLAPELVSPEVISMPDVVERSFVPARLFCTQGTREALAALKADEGLPVLFQNLAALSGEGLKKTELLEKFQIVMGSLNALSLGGKIKVDVSDWNPLGARLNLVELFPEQKEGAAKLQIVFDKLEEAAADYKAQVEKAESLSHACAEAPTEGRRARSAHKKLKKQEQEEVASREEKMGGFQRAARDFEYESSTFAQVCGLASSKFTPLYRRVEILERMLNAEADIATLQNRADEARGPVGLAALGSFTRSAVFLAAIMDATRRGTLHTANLDEIQDRVIGEKIKSLAPESEDRFLPHQELELIATLNVLGLPYRPAMSLNKASWSGALCISHALIDLCRETKEFYARYLEETAAAAASITGVDRNLIDLAKEPAFWQAARNFLNKQREDLCAGAFVREMASAVVFEIGESRLSDVKGPAVAFTFIPSTEVEIPLEDLQDWKDILPQSVIAFAVQSGKPLKFGRETPLTIAMPLEDVQESPDFPGLKVMGTSYTKSLGRRLNGACGDLDRLNLLLSVIRGNEKAEE